MIRYILLTIALLVTSLVKGETTCSYDHENFISIINQKIKAAEYLDSLQNTKLSEECAFNVAISEFTLSVVYETSKPKVIEHYQKLKALPENKIYPKLSATLQCNVALSFG